MKQRIKLTWKFELDVICSINSPFSKVYTHILILTESWPSGPCDLWNIACLKAWPLYLFIIIFFFIQNSEYYSFIYIFMICFLRAYSVPDIVIRVINGLAIIAFLFYTHCDFIWKFRIGKLINVSESKKVTIRAHSQRTHFQRARGKFLWQ